MYAYRYTDIYRSNKHLLSLLIESLGVEPSRGLRKISDRRQDIIIIIIILILQGPVRSWRV